jgi:hypothetical protein
MLKARSITAEAMAVDWAIKRYAPGLGEAGCDAGVEAVAGNQQAAAGRAQDTHQVRARRVEDGLVRGGQFARRHPFPHRRPGDYGASTECAELGDDRRHVGQRGADDGQFRHHVEIIDMHMGAQAEQGSPLGRDRDHRSGEAAAGQVAQQYFGVTAGFVGLGNHRDRLRAEQEFKIADGHGCAVGSARAALAQQRGHCAIAASGTAGLVPALHAQRVHQARAAKAIRASTA